MKYSCVCCDKMISLEEMYGAGLCLDCYEEFGDIDPDEYFDDPVEEEEDEYWI